MSKSQYQNLDQTKSFLFNVNMSRAPNVGTRSMSLGPNISGMKSSRIVPNTKYTRINQIKMSASANGNNNDP